MLIHHEKHHGRGRPDGLGGETKAGVDEAVREDVDVRDISKSVAYLNETLSKETLCKSSCKIHCPRIWIDRSS